MRYFDLKITKNSAGNNKNASETLLHFSSYLQQNGMPGGSPLTGFFDPAYLNIEFDYVSTSDSITPQAQLKIFGVDLSTLRNASRLVGATLTVSAGMGHGLPLSDPATAGTILTGEIKYAGGNWANQTDSTHPGNPNRTTCLELYCDPIKLPKKIKDKEEENSEKNENNKKTEDFFNFECEPNQKLADALEQCFKGYAIDTSQIQEILCKEEKIFIPLPFDNLIQKITDLTCSWGMKENYIVACHRPNGTYRFFQNGSWDTLNPILTLNFQDLMGQPVYYKDYNAYDEHNDFNISVTTPLRADIAVGDIIKLPDDQNGGNLYGILTSLPDKGNQFMQSSAFSGYWQVRQIEYVAHSRDPDGQKWASTFGLKRFNHTVISKDIPTSGQSIYNSNVL